MSHTMNIETEMRDLAVLKATCKKLGLEISNGEHGLYNSTETGLAVKLPGWKYPAVVKADGKIAYDNYGGSWGKQSELGKLTAHYGIEKAKIEARKKGYSVIEGRNVKGDLTLKIRLEG